MMVTFKDYVAAKKQEIKAFVATLALKPKLVIINVGDDPASQIYVKGKLADCAECGIQAELLHYDSEINECVLYDKIKELNMSPDVTGYIIQLPLPKQFDADKLINMIDPIKDVDGFSKLHITDPATPKGILDYLVDKGYEFKDKNAVVIGRSAIVGVPVARLLLAKDCNVVQLHSKTSEVNKRLFLENADLIVTAVGKNNIIDSTYKLKPTAWIIDVGMNRDENNKLIGDCARDLSVELQTTTPGSTGLSTRLALITNLIDLYKLQQNK